jgi:hypothetical protein
VADREAAGRAGLGRHGRVARAVRAVHRLFATVAAPLIGVPAALPPALAERWPELHEARYRRGGLPPRIGGWCLGQRSVAAITLWRTVWLAADTPHDVGLLLHELRHVHQFLASPAFPLRYVVESARRGYHGNRYEVDARDYAAERLTERLAPRYADRRGETVIPFPSQDA